MNAGDALLAARELVPPGAWQAYLRKTDISKRSARVYMQVAKARTVLEGQSSAGPLSIAAALQFLKDPEASKRKLSAKTIKATTPFDTLRWWSNATGKARQQFLDGVGLIGLLTALPPDWRTELERRVVNLRKERGDPNAKLTTIFRTAMSHLAIADAPQTTKPIAQSQELAALNALRGIARMHVDFHDLTIGIRKAEQTRQRGRAA
jgi:hypothetical protein